MKWIIKNPAPSDSRRRKWGDFHFGRAIEKYLTRMGHEVVTQYDPSWDEDMPADVVLLLRGKYPFPPNTSHGGALRVMWNISHPDDVLLEEYDSHDVVCVASRPWAKELSGLLGREVVPLLQCTDTEEFFPREPGAIRNRRDVIFIGNTRQVRREIVFWALEYGLPLKVWGRGWSEFEVPEEVVQGGYFPNEDLGELYSRARVTLNDHWDDMKKYGFVNNRIFDALACELPVISDWHEELTNLIPEGVLTYRSRAEFARCIEQYALGYPAVHRSAQEAGVAVRREFSFEHRVKELVTLVTHSLK